MSYQDDDDDDEQDAREAYPFLYGVAEEPYVPLRDQLKPKYQKILDEERAKLAARREVAEEHGEDYHNLQSVSADELPALNFRRYGNLFLARPAKAFHRPAQKSLSECLVEHGCFISVSKSVSFGVSNGTRKKANETQKYVSADSAVI